MIGDAQEIVRDTKSWKLVRYVSRAGTVALVLSSLIDLRIGDTSLSPYLFGLGVIVAALGALGERRLNEIRDELLVICLIGAAYALVTVGKDVVDEEVWGVPLAYVAAAVVAIPAVIMMVAELVGGFRKSLRDSLLALGALALVGIFALQEADWHEEILWHVRQDEAVQFYLALIIAFATCIAFREAGNHRIWIAMSLGLSVSALLLPWYLVDLEFAFQGFAFDLDFLRRPDEDVAYGIAIAGVAGGLAILLVKHPLAPWAAGAAGALIALLSLTSMDRFEGFANSTLLAGFYVTLVSAATATVLSLWLAVKLANPPPDPNVIPRMKEQFPRL